MDINTFLKKLASLPENIRDGFITQLTNLSTAAAASETDLLKAQAKALSTETKQTHKIYNNKHQFVLDMKEGRLNEEYVKHYYAVLNLAEEIAGRMNPDNFDFTSYMNENDSNAKLILDRDGNSTQTYDYGDGKVNYGDKSKNFFNDAEYFKRQNVRNFQNKTPVISVQNKKIITNVGSGIEEQLGLYSNTIKKEVFKNVILNGCFNPNYSNLITSVNVFEIPNSTLYNVEINTNISSYQYKDTEEILKALLHTSVILKYQPKYDDIQNYIFLLKSELSVGVYANNYYIKGEYKLN